MKLFIITGQTATGKTKLALEMANKYKGELVNCDARQIYKHLDIVTGKDLDKNSKFEIQNSKFGNFDIGHYNLDSIRIWLYDIININQVFSSFNYEDCALKAIKDIIKRGKTPILVDGSGFYIRQLLYAPSVKNDNPPDWRLRQGLEGKTVIELQKILKNSNSKLFGALNSSDKQNPRRLIRRIEMSKQPTIPKLSLVPLLRQKLGLNDLRIKIIGLKFESREKGQARIADRVEKRWQQGAADEIANLLKIGFKPTDPGFKTLGCQLIINYLQNKITLDEVKRLWMIEEAQYAKRQLTFLKKIPAIEWQIIH